MKSEDALEGRLNGDKDTLDELDESRKEDKNGYKTKFMFNIADGGFTGKNKSDFVFILNEPLTKEEQGQVALKQTKSLF